MIGASIPRREDARLLSGQGQFTDDLHRDAQVWVAFVRSPHAHAVVEAIRADTASAQPDVLGVFTGTDLRADGIEPIPALLAERSGGTRNRDGSIIREPLWWPVAVDRVRHVGEPVAFVVATTRDAARDAADLVEVDYRPLSAVVDAADALRSDAPQLFDDRPRNVVIDWSTGHAAAVERAFVRAAHVERAEMFAQRLSPAYIEPRSALASYDGSSGRFTLEVCAQAVHALAAAMARELGVPNEAVRCISRDVGGAFGGKNYPYPEYVVCLWAARRFGRPFRSESRRALSLIRSGEGAYVYGGAGKRDFDATSGGVMVANVADAMAAQAKKLAFAFLGQVDNHKPPAFGAGAAGSRRATEAFPRLIDVAPRSADVFRFTLARVCEAFLRAKRSAMGRPLEEMRGSILLIARADLILGKSHSRVRGNPGIAGIE